MATTQLTIEEVEQQFKQWRSKKQLREKIPDYLWSMVQQLMKLYPPSRIIRHLSLSGKQMRRKGLLPLPHALPEESSPFVNIKLPLLSSTSPQLVIQRTDGARLSCTNLSDDQFILSIKAFLNTVSE